MANNKPTYKDLEDWTTQFLSSKTTEQRIAHINRLAAHNFACSFDLKDKEFVSLLIETLYDTANNLNFGSEVMHRCESKAIQLLEPLKDEWNHLRSPLWKVVATSGLMMYPSKEHFIQTFIEHVDPSDSPDAIGAFVNHLCGWDQLHKLESDHKWVGHPLVIDWIMRSLGMKFSDQPVSKMTVYQEYKDKITQKVTGNNIGNLEALKSLLFHLAAAGDLDQITNGLAFKYIND